MTPRRSREKAKRCAGLLSFPTRFAQGFGLRVSACRDQYDRRRSRTLAGEAFTGDTMQSPRLGSQPSEPRRKASVSAERIGRQRGRLGRAFERHKRASEVETIGSTLHEVRKVQGESASSALKRCRSSGASDRSRPKLATANSFVDSPFPDRANGWEKM